MPADPAPTGAGLEIKNTRLQPPASFSQLAMSHAQTIAIAHLSPAVSVHVALFTNVRNAAFLRAQLLAGNQRFEYAFIDASALISSTQLLAAVFRACSALTSSPSRLRTRNVHAEVVFCLSPTNNIAESFKRFGVGDETTSLVAVKVSHPEAEMSLGDVRKHLDEVVQGTCIDFNDANLEKSTDWAVVKKVYKLHVGEAAAGKRSKDAANGEAEITAAQRKDAETAVLGMMALKGS